LPKWCCSVGLRLLPTSPAFLHRTSRLLLRPS
jgi:hypothetical protein